MRKGLAINIFAIHPSHCLSAALLVILLRLCKPPHTSSPPFYPIEETGMQYCYNFLGIFPCPDEVGILYGQDANYLGASFNFSDNANGTINDAVSGLTWQQIQSNSRASLADCSTGMPGSEFGWKK